MRKTKAYLSNCWEIFSNLGFQAREISDDVEAAAATAFHVIHEANRSHKRRFDSYPILLPVHVLGLTCFSDRWDNPTRLPLLFLPLLRNPKLSIVPCQKRCLPFQYKTTTPYSRPSQRPIIPGK